MAVRGLVPPIKAPGAPVCCGAFRSQGGGWLCGGPGSRSLAACGSRGAAGVLSAGPPAPASVRPDFPAPSA